MDSDFLNSEFLGNTLRDYLWCLLILALGLILKRICSNLISKLIFVVFKRYGREVGMQKFVRLMSRPFEFLILLIIVYAAFNRLVFPLEWRLAPEQEFGFRLVIL